MHSWGVSQSTLGVWKDDHGQDVGQDWSSQQWYKQKKQERVDVAKMTETMTEGTSYDGSAGTNSGDSLAWFSQIHS